MNVNKQIYTKKSENLNLVLSGQTTPSALLARPRCHNTAETLDCQKRLPAMYFFKKFGSEDHQVRIWCRNNISRITGLTVSKTRFHFLFKLWVGDWWNVVDIRRRRTYKRYNSSGNTVTGREEKMTYKINNNFPSFFKQKEQAWCNMSLTSVKLLILFPCRSVHSI